MNKIIGKLCFGVFILGMGCLVLSSCDSIKQMISDTLAPEIEEKVNEMLQDAGIEEEFHLPEATRYEGFALAEEENISTYKIEVIEPKVTFEEYAEDLAKTLGTTFTKEEIEDVKNQEKWTYLDEGGNTYTLHFSEILDEEGKVGKWKIEVIVAYPMVEGATE